MKLFPKNPPYWTIAIIAWIVRFIRMTLRNNLEDKANLFSKKNKPSTENGKRKTVNGHPSTENRHPSTENGQRSTVNGKPSTENGPPSTENGKRKTENRPPSTENRQRSTVNGQRSTENGPPSTENGKRSTVNGQPSTENRPPSTVNGKRSTAVIIALWHNRLLFTTALFPHWYRKNLTTVASSSRDGGYATSFVKNFGLQVVRGSSSKNAVRAVIGLKKALEGGSSVAITVDGPRGPKYKVQQGIIYLAAKTKIPIIPVALNSSSYWQLGGWDKTQIPKPFSKTNLVIGKPIHINLGENEKLSTETKEKYSKLLEKELLKITKDP
ncbi:MAG: lysophospholipid acyltransferase family protein [Verrucomicrobiota bacterium]|nr:lysophospholipid acyltransferase family protein [Verrucomicrobiota bacterium]